MARAGFVHITEIVYCFGHASDLVAEAHLIYTLQARVLGCFCLCLHSMLALEERKLLKLQLQTIESQMKSSNDAAEARRRFIRYIFHEIRVPFNSVMMGTQLLLEDFTTAEAEGQQRKKDDDHNNHDTISKTGDEGASGDDQEFIKVPRESLETLRTIFAAGSNMAVIMNDVLDISKIEAGKFQMFREPLSLKDLGVQSLSQMRPFADGKGVQLSLFLDPRLPSFVLGDQTRLLQALSNFISNGIKFCPDGGQGRVDIRIEVVSTGRSASLTASHAATSPTSRGAQSPLSSSDLRISIRSRRGAEAASPLPVSNSLRGFSAIFTTGSTRARSRSGEQSFFNGGGRQRVGTGDAEASDTPRSVADPSPVPTAADAAGAGVSVMTYADEEASRQLDTIGGASGIFVQAARASYAAAATVKSMLAPSAGASSAGPSRASFFRAVAASARPAAGSPSSSSSALAAGTGISPSAPAATASATSTPSGSAAKLTAQPAAAAASSTSEPARGPAPIDIERLRSKGFRVIDEGEAGQVTIAISVSDNGCGIPPEEIAKMFQPFVQLQAGLQYKGNGTGLGLAITKSIAESLGGTVRVESQLDVKTTFTLTAPFQVVVFSPKASPPPSDLKATDIDPGGAFDTSNTNQVVKPPAPTAHCPPGSHAAPSRAADSVVVVASAGTQAHPGSTNPASSSAHAVQPAHHQHRDAAGAVERMDTEATAVTLHTMGMTENIEFAMVDIGGGRHRDEEAGASAPPAHHAADGSNHGRALDTGLNNSGNSDVGAVAHGTTAAVTSSRHFRHNARFPGVHVDLTRHTASTHNARIAFFGTNTSWPASPSNPPSQRASRAAGGGAVLREQSVLSPSAAVASPPAADDHLTPPERVVHRGSGVRPGLDLECIAIAPNSRPLAMAHLRVDAGLPPLPRSSASLYSMPNGTPSHATINVSSSPVNHAAAASGAGQREEELQLQQHAFATDPTAPAPANASLARDERISAASTSLSAHTKGGQQPILTSTGKDSRPLRWLIVDDVASNRKLLIALLKRRFKGSKVFDEAGDGQACLNMCSQPLSPVPDGSAGGDGGLPGQPEPAAGSVASYAGCQYDVICMDGSMPVLDGYDATRALRAGGYTGLILACTGNALATDQDAFLSSGADAVLVKPINADTVVMHVDRLHGGGAGIAGLGAGPGTR